MKLLGLLKNLFINNNKDIKAHKDRQKNVLVYKTAEFWLIVNYLKAYMVTKCFN